MSACVLWSGTLSREGYARAWRDGRDVEMHRYLYVQRFGALPAGVVLHHTCGVKHCVNLAHLTALSLAEHRRLHGAIQTHCRNGHPRTPETIYRPPSGGTQCRLCHREQNRENMARYRAEGRAYAR